MEVTTLNKNDATMEQGKELVKRKMKPRGGNSPVIGDNGVHTKPGDNSKIAGFLMEVGKWGPVDKSDVQAWKSDSGTMLLFALREMFVSPIR